MLTCGFQAVQSCHRVVRDASNDYVLDALAVKPDAVPADQFYVAFGVTSQFFAALSFDYLAVFRNPPYEVPDGGDGGDNGDSGDSGDNGDSGDSGDSGDNGDSGDSGSSLVCFGAAMEVSVMRRGVEAASTAPLADVRSGDRVLSVDARGRPVYSEVFRVQHGDDLHERMMLRIDAQGAQKEASLIVSARHLVATRGKDGKVVLVAADALAPGSVLLSPADSGGGGGDELVVRSVTSTKSRVRNVHTMNDRIVVGGVVASCMTAPAPYLPISADAHPAIGSALFTPLKILHKLGQRRAVELLDGALHRLGVSLF